MTQYQGHCADGSGIQKHSASDIYPHVITARGEITWGIINGYTGETIWGYATAQAAAEAGAAIKALHDAKLAAQQPFYNPAAVIDGCDVSARPGTLEYVLQGCDASNPNYPGPVPARIKGIGAYAYWLIKAFGNYDNGTLARMVRERFPEARTNRLNIAWYRWKVRNV